MGADSGTRKDGLSSILDSEEGLEASSDSSDSSSLYDFLFLLTCDLTS